MLVIISDLHLTDGTSDEFGPSEGARMIYCVPTNHSDASTRSWIVRMTLTATARLVLSTLPSCLAIGVHAMAVQPISTVITW